MYEEFNRYSVLTDEEIKQKEKRKCIASSVTFLPILLLLNPTSLQSFL